jgi:hypothetical protein
MMATAILRAAKIRRRMGGRGADSPPMREGIEHRELVEGFRAFAFESGEFGLQSDGSG